MKLTKVFLAGVVAFLASCGGGGESEPIAATATQAVGVPQRQAQQAASSSTSQLRVFQALHGRAPSAAEFTSFGDQSSMLLGASFAATLASLSDAEFSRAVLANLGIDGRFVNAMSLALLDSALVQYFGIYGADARGIVVNNLVGILANLEDDVTWGVAARAFNARVAANLLSLSPAASGKLTLTSIDSFFGREREIVLPFSGAGSSTASILGSTIYTIETFKLAASGRNFTIADVSARDASGVVVPSFNGLSSGQTIANGQTATFSLVSPLTRGRTAQLTYSFAVQETGQTFTYSVSLRTN